MKKPELISGFSALFGFLEKLGQGLEQHRGQKTDQCPNKCHDNGYK